MTEIPFAKRVSQVPKSFIREILKVAGEPDVISFAGGLPHPGLFPVRELVEAFSSMMQERGSESLQYGPSEGILPLREWICDRYRKRYGLDILPANVLVTTGSQQGLDIAGKVLLDENDSAAMERPGYLGAIQAFSFYTGRILQVPLEENGPDICVLESMFEQERPKIFYAIPNFQNPSGLSYDLSKRKAVAELCSRYGTCLVEDDPYGELRFAGKELPAISSFMDGNWILLGTLSKVAAPGLRLGWIAGDNTILDKMLVAKQAADLHTSTLTQQLAWQYLSRGEIDEHIGVIRKAYGRQRDCMVSMIKKYFPPQVSFTQPEGGMFLWVTLPDGCSSLELFNQAIRMKVAFVPGAPFYVDGGGVNTMRLNFSNAEEPEIEEGIRRLGVCLNSYLKNTPV